ncbi:MAG: NAD(+) synthase [Bacteroidaceae bacterium]|nr:NAD(+) synthase [Bacteroidaceae bacterium]
MKYGFVKVSATTPEIAVANCDRNAKEIIELTNELAKKETELILFPELCLTSCSCGDLFTQPHFIQACNNSIAKIAKETAVCDCVIVLGAPIENRNSLYNCAIIIYKGEIIGIVPKRILNSKIGESRWFTSSDNLSNDSHATIAGKKIPFVKNGLFCTDSYSFGIEIGNEAATLTAPGAELAACGATIILNPTAQRAVAGTHKDIQRNIAEQSARYKCGYIYAGIGWGESTSVATYPGYCAIAENGEIIAESGYHIPGAHYTITDIDTEKCIKERKGDNCFACTTTVTEIYIPQAANHNTTLTRHFTAQPFIPKGYTLTEYCNEVFAIQAVALAKRLTHTGAKRCVIGISGGLDSTLALLVTAKACDIIGMPRNSITAVTMPGFGTSDRTYNNALTLMQALGTRIREISIKEACIQHFKDIEHDINTHDVTYENAQARERTQILMDIANQENGIVIGTGDLSELALGWATYNGDQMSMYGVNASVPKTLMQHMVRNIAGNEADEKVKYTLLDIVDTPISPELTPADNEGNIKQKTENLVGPYELHDFFIYHFVRHGFAPEKIHLMATTAFDGKYDSETIKKWLTTFIRRFFTQQFKRSAMPDGPQATCCALDPQNGWIMTSDTSYAMWMQNCERIE